MYHENIELLNCFFVHCSENKVLDRTLIKSLEYSQTADSSQLDTITITYWIDKHGRSKKNFQALFNDLFQGHRFVALMKTFVAPDKVSDHYKFGRGYVCFFCVFKMYIGVQNRSLL